MRACFLHIGTHKTGSTSLQVLLAHSRETLANAGLYVTAEGRSAAASTGNHELAWDLLARGRDADLSKVVEELRANPCTHAIITSEDFDRLHSRPDAIPALVDAIRGAGYTPKVIVYLRGQPSYAESVYVEMIKHGIVIPMRDFIGPILAEGRYQREGLGFTEFTYSRLLASWVDAVGRHNVAVRAYDPRLDSMHIYKDFFSAIEQHAPGFSVSGLPLSVPTKRVNDSLTYGELLDTAYRKLFPRGLPEVEPRAILGKHLRELPQELLDRRYALMRREDTLRFLDVFGKDNDEIARVFGADIAFRTVIDIAPENAEIWEEARVERATFEWLMTLWRNAPPRSNEQPDADNEQDQRKADAESAFG